MDSVLTNALQETSLRVFTAVRVTLRSGTTLRLLDGNGTVRFDIDGVSNAFSNKHSNYGVLGHFEALEEKVAEDAPRWRFTIFPPNVDAIALWNDIEEQGSLVEVWYGAVDQVTGAVLGAPEKVWKGRLDTVRTLSNKNQLTIEVDTNSAFERLFVAEEAARLNGVWHQRIWAGETGLDYVYFADETVHWGNDGTEGKKSSSGGGFGGIIRRVAPHAK